MSAHSNDSFNDGVAGKEYSTQNRPRQNSSPGVIRETVVLGPLPAPLTAATETVYCVDGLSPVIIACLEAMITPAVPSTVPSALVAVTV